MTEWTRPPDKLCQNYEHPTNCLKDYYMFRGNFLMLLCSVCHSFSSREPERHFT